MRKIVDERDARACLKAAKAAGLTAGEWGRAHGVDGRSLNAWRINLAQRGSTSLAPRSKPRLIELVPAPSVVGSAQYIVRVAGAEIEVSDGFDEAMLVRLVRALRSC